MRNAMIKVSNLHELVYVTTQLCQNYQKKFFIRKLKIKGQVKRTCDALLTKKWENKRNEREKVGTMIKRFSCNRFLRKLFVVADWKLVWLI